MNFDFFKSAPAHTRILLRVLLVTCILLILCPIVVGIANGIDSAGNRPEDSGNAGGDGTDAPAELYTTIPVASSDVYAKGTLRVVSANAAIRFYPETSQLIGIYGDHMSSSYKIKISTFLLESEALTAFNSMLDAYFAESQDNSVLITSAFRSESEQAAINPATVGLSDHHLALSLALKLNDGQNTAELPENHWVYRNGYRYGYIQRYPAGKEESTGISEYYNCIRYVGVPHATYMHENDLSLEEYVSFVKSYRYGETHLTVTAEGATYEIYYVPANLTESLDTAITTLPVPKELSYTYSGNNTDGFIVTVRVS